MSSAAGSRPERGTAGPGRNAGAGQDAAETGADPGDVRRAVMRARHAASKARQAAESQARQARCERELFARPARDYVYQALGRPVAVLRAGSQAPIEELGLAKLRRDGFEISIITVDTAGGGTSRKPGGPRHGARPSDVRPGAHQELAGGDVLRGDLRTVPLPGRAFDIVYCGFLLERIPHAPLVLDRLVAALRPGGLLLLRVRDRDCAAAALDRLLPGPARRAVWARLRPGEPGPYPAVYDPLVCARGIQAYALAHGLVITRREVARTPPGPPGRLTTALSAAQALIAWLTRGRRTNEHDELLYVIRKPEDRFARLV
jgi:SAM-dependent methyltransferase